MPQLVVVIGNGLSALVAAQSLGDAGIDVVLLNQSTIWGGHFRSLEILDTQFDLGMTLYEFGSFNSAEEASLASYNSNIRNDCGRFVNQVRDYVTSRIDMAPVPDLMMYMQGRLRPDIFISNRVDALRDLAPGTQAQMEAELKLIVGHIDASVHASEKSHSGYFDELDLEAASVANHGRSFHDLFIEPFCTRALGVPTREILGRFHRGAWLPLYYPETLLSQFTDAPQRLPVTRFHYPSHASAAAITSAVYFEVSIHPRVQIVHGTPTRIRRTSHYEIALETGEKIRAKELVWSSDLNSLCQALEVESKRAKYQSAGVGICFLLVPASRISRRISSIFVLDSTCVYRITNQDVCAGATPSKDRLVIEFDARYFERAGILEPEHQWREIAIDLQRIGLLEEDDPGISWSIRYFKEALVLPTKDNRTIVGEQRRRILESLPEVQLIGPSAGFGAGSMNDQIVQGLKIAVDFGGRLN